MSFTFSGRRVLSLKSSPSDIQCRSAQCAEAWWLRTSLLAPKTTLANLTASLKPNGFLSNNGENKPEAGDNTWKTQTYICIDGNPWEPPFDSNLHTGIHSMYCLQPVFWIESEYWLRFAFADAANGCWISKSRGNTPEEEEKGLVASITFLSKHH